MRAALVLTLLLVAVPAGVFAFAKSQPREPLAVPRSVVKQRFEQQLPSQGYTYVSAVNRPIGGSGGAESRPSG